MSSDLFPTIAGGAIIGLGLWFLRKQFRKASGFKEPLPAVEPFPTSTEVLAVKEQDPVCIIRPGVIAVRAYVLKRWGGVDAGICGDQAHQQRASEHNVGRAWDWKIPNAEAAKEFFDWVSADDWNVARRLGFGMFIHKGKIWSSWIDAPGPMIRAYTGSNPHNAHIHISFSHDGADGKTSGYKSGLLT